MTEVLFVSRQRVAGRLNGSSTYLIDLAQAVREAGLVPRLVQPSPTIMGRTPFLWLTRDLDVFADHHVRGVIKLGRVLLSIDPQLYVAFARGIAARIGRKVGLKGGWTVDRPNPYSVAIPWTPADLAYVRAHRGNARVALADYVFQTEGFAALAFGTATGIVMHDLFHARPGSGEGGETDSVAQLGRDEEVAMLGRADAVIAIQAAEAHFVATEQPGVRVVVAPMAARCVDRPAPGEDRRVLFVGSNTAPNIVGLRWFFAEVWPLIRAHDPGIELEVAGKVAQGFAGEPTPPGVRFLGLVDDLAGLYRRAAVVISPLTFGSGLKIKLIEALAHGKAIVATSVTLQGVEGHTDALIHADEPAAFADAVVRLALDGQARATLAEAALAMARERFSPEACYGPFVDWLRAVSA